MPNRLFNRIIFDTAVIIAMLSLHSKGAVLYGGNYYKTDALISGTDEPELYQHEMYGSELTIVFPDVPAGMLVVEFGAAEIYFTESGKRVFSINAANTQLVSDLDLYAAAGGKNVAYNYSWTVNHSGGDLTMTLHAAVNNAKFSLVRVMNEAMDITYDQIYAKEAESSPLPPPSANELTFFNADHAPIGAYATLLYGEKNSGGLIMELGRNFSIPSNGVLIASIQGTRRKVMPFVSAGSGSSSYADSSINRKIRASTDEWTIDDGLSWTHYSPAWAMKDFETASEEEKKRFTTPATWMEFTVDNTSGTENRDLIFSLRESSSTPFSTGAFHGYTVSGRLTVNGTATIAALSGESDLISSSEVYNLLGIGSANSALRFRTPPGETKTFSLVIGFYSDKEYGSDDNAFRAGYYYRKYFNGPADVVDHAWSLFADVKKWGGVLDGDLETSGLNGYRKFLCGHTTHSYRFSTFLLEPDSPVEGPGEYIWCVAEGSYAYINTLDLTADHLFYELAMHPWTMRNQLDFFASRYNYHDSVKTPSGQVYPGGISFCHDMGKNHTFTAAGKSNYENIVHHGFMTQEELQNWILCSAVYTITQGKSSWLTEKQTVWEDVLDSMLIRDDVNPSARDGITSCINVNHEITTYDSLDSSLKSVRDNLYIAVKSWASYVLLEKVFTELEDDNRAQICRDAASRTAAAVAAKSNGQWIPAIFDGSNTSRIIPAVEALSYVHYAGLEDAVSTTGPYADLISALSVHLDTILVSGTCLDSTSGGWKLSSTSTNTWQSKVYLSQYVAEQVLGMSDARVVGDVDAIHADFQANQVGVSGWCDQLNSGSGTDRGSKHYPRGVTSMLWWGCDAVSLMEQTFPPPLPELSIETKPL